MTCPLLLLYLLFPLVLSFFFPLSMDVLVNWHCCGGGGSRAWWNSWCVQLWRIQSYTNMLLKTNNNMYMSFKTKHTQIYSLRGILTKYSIIHNLLFSLKVSQVWYLVWLLWHFMEFNYHSKKPFSIHFPMTNSGVLWRKSRSGNHGLWMDTTHTHQTAARRAKLLRFTTTLLLKSHDL